MKDLYNRLPGEGGQIYFKIFGFLVLFIALGSPAVQAQDKDRIRVKAGEKIGSRDFTYAAYRFPAFQEGVIHYNAGSPAKGKLNYNQILGEMHFISPKGDTLALDNLYLVNRIEFKDSRFYYDPENKGFGEEVADFKTVKLLIKHKFKPSDKESGVAYNQYSNTASTTSFSSFPINGQVHQLSINEYLVLAKRASYFLTDQNNIFYPANKTNILRIFSKHKPAVEKFMKENRIDFQKEADLKKLLGFCTELT